MPSQHITKICTGTIKSRPVFCEKIKDCKKAVQLSMARDMGVMCKGSSMINRPPEKPKNYWRDYSIIVLLALIPLPIALYFDIKYINPLLPIFIVTVVPLFWFRSYYSELSRYKGLETADVRPKVNKESKVNENIARYVKEQKERKSLAKWWQFWI